MNDFFVDKESLSSTLASWDKEIDHYWEEIENFRSMHVLEILKRLSAYHARAARMRKKLMDSANRNGETFRIKKLDPFLAGLEFQFKTWSRIAAIMTTEWEISQRD